MRGRIIRNLHAIYVIDISYRLSIIDMICDWHRCYCEGRRHGALWPHWTSSLVPHPFSPILLFDIETYSPMHSCLKTAPSSRSKDCHRMADHSSTFSLDNSMTTVHFSPRKSFIWRHKSSVFGAYDGDSVSTGHFDSVISFHRRH